MKIFKFKHSSRERNILKPHETKQRLDLYKAANLRVSYERAHTLLEFVNCTKKLDGEMAEMGVYKGSTAYLIAESIKDTNKKLYLFDTFEGTPDICGENDKSRAGQYADTSEQSVLNFLEEYKSNIILKKGFIPNTFDGLNNTVFSFIHVHLNLYKSTLNALCFSYPNLIMGGIIVIEDYGLNDCNGVKKAVDEYCAKNSICVIHLTSGQGVIIKND